MIVAIDGPAGAGKSTVARAVAARLGFAYLDTGALYRCAVLVGVRSGRSPAEVVPSMEIRLGDRVLLGDEDVSEAIRSPEISRLTPTAAARPELRAALNEKQRTILAHGDWVAEGRDVGSVVAPQADVKVYLTASLEQRAHRRALEHDLDLGQIRQSLIERDRLDEEREHAPLHVADDAVEIDTTDMSLDEAVEAIVALVPSEYTQTPALFAVSPEGVDVARKRRRAALGR